jgi:hypothetical protein
MRSYRWVFDFLSVLVFVAIGRSTHDHGISVSGLASTTWPFGVGVIGGGVVLRTGHHSGKSSVDGLLVALVTVGVGMILRVLTGQGTAFAFIIVAIVFLSAFMLGWRFVARWLGRRHR